MPYDHHVNAITRASSAIGGPSALARRLGVKPPTVHQWLTGARPVPPQLVPAIEAATGVRRWSLRPSDWHLIWPELIGAEGAPAVPPDVKGPASAA
jgi:DNA-binding transcriptional regulator YdaS (Cro superfamily)